MSGGLNKAFPNFGLFVIRVGLGGLFILHGYPKIMAGPEMWEKLGGTMALIGVTFAPVFWGFMAAFAESLGALFLAAGIFSRISAAMLAFTMFMASYMHHMSGDDFMKATSRPLELMFVFLGLFLTGPGTWSLDRLIQKKKEG